METEKNSRMLELFFRVLRGETISVKAVAAEYGVSTKSIGRDIGKIQEFLAEHRDQVFNEYLDSYLKEHQALFNDQAWEKLSISGYQGAASANFYTIYQQYFSEQQ